MYKNGDLSYGYLMVTVWLSCGFSSTGIVPASYRHSTSGLVDDSFCHQFAQLFECKALKAINVNKHCQIKSVYS